MTPDDMRRAIKAHARLSVDTPEGPRWLQVVLQDGPRWVCVCSQPHSSHILAIEDASIFARRPDPPVPVQPSTFDPGKVSAEAGLEGHNGIALVALLLAHFRLPASFAYAKPRRPIETRHVDLAWATAEGFGGADRDREGALRSFRLDRTYEIGLHPEATTRPVWTEGAYRRGLL